MLPYGIIFTVLCLNGFLNKKETKILNFIVFTLFILFYSLRNEVGSDWSAYNIYFNNIKDYDIVSRYSFEPLFRLFNVFSATIFPTFRWMVFFVGIFNGYLFWNSTKKYTQNIGIVMLLSSFYMFYPTLEAFRQSISLFLFYYSLRYLENSSKKYLIINLISFMFHRTGIIAILFFLFYKSKLAKKIIIFSMFFFYMIEPYFMRLLQHIPILYSKYIWYFHVEEFNTRILSFKLLEYILFIIIFYYFSKKEKLDSFSKLNYNLILMGALIQVTIGQLSSIIYRMSYYFDIGIIFGFVFVYDRLKEPIQKVSYVMFIILYLLARFNRVFPYDNPIFYYSL